MKQPYLSPPIKHYLNCTADYPEKVKGEAPQAIQIIEIDDGEEVHQCVDCGAFVVLPQKETK